MKFNPIKLIKYLILKKFSQKISPNQRTTSVLIPCVLTPREHFFFFFWYFIQNNRFKMLENVWPARHTIKVLFFEVRHFLCLFWISLPELSKHFNWNWFILRWSKEQFPKKKKKKWKIAIIYLLNTNLTTLNIPRLNCSKH